MIDELDRIVLTIDLPGHRLTPGDIGTVVRVHENGGYEIEFVALAGETIAVETLMPGQVRAIGPDEGAHSRQLARSA